MNPVVMQTVCRDFSQSSQLEWLETNGTGGFAMGTVCGVNTRRYHGLLVASLHPPVERCVLLSRVEETVAMEGVSFELGVCQYPGVVTPRGYQHLESFTPLPCATWRYALGPAIVEKQVYMVQGRQAVVLRYRANRDATLQVRPFLAYRNYHALGQERLDLYGDLPHLEFRFDGHMSNDAHWYKNVEYLEELDRGLDFREDLYSPGVMTVKLKAGQWASICASIDGTDACEPPQAKADPFVVRRADGNSTIIAGYPWFTDWGRDTMISLPGLLLTSGRLNEAQAILQGFLAHVNQGLLPNRFPEHGETPEYNSADGTLWMFQAVRQWLEAGGDRAFLRDVFYPEAKEIIAWHRRGTWFGIHVGSDDGLLRAGSPGTQLTWMDAKVGGWVVTPRHGKAVEVNALWHGALCSMAEWAEECGDADGHADYLRASQEVRQSFGARFWNADRQSLRDVLDADDTLRPNQIFAVSLPYDLLTRSQQQSVVRSVQEKLLTPLGLRTLDPADPAYRGRYQGGPAERDAAYHQGTVWPWLLGPFIDAYLRAFGKTDDALQYCRTLLRGLDAESETRGCLGSLAEIYDGDEPRFPRGCPAQAWSVAEIARVRATYGL